MATPRRKRSVRARNTGLRHQAELPFAADTSASKPPPPPLRMPRGRSDALWACLYFPTLALDVFAGMENVTPCVVVEGEGGRRQVIACDDAARVAGIEPAMKEAGALALEPRLQCLPRQPTLETRALERLATWAGQFSSEVSLEAPYAVLFEIGGSLKLFGGLETLFEQVHAGLEILTYRFISACAPTPAAAVLLARAGGEYARDGVEMRRILAALPTAMLPWPQTALERLEGMGVRCLRDCLRLPRDGLARRFGPEAVISLDRLMGRLPDPRRRHVPPPVYDGEIELPVETVAHGLLLQGASRLLAELAGELRRRQAGVQSLDLKFIHRRCEPTHLVLGLAQPAGDIAYLQRVLDQRLQRFVMAAPVHRVSLHAGRFIPRVPDASDIFNDGTAPADALALVDDLRARLGEAAVCSLCLVPEHRPEAAWNRIEPGMSSWMQTLPPRPLWLLEAPRRLAVHAGRPVYQGALTMLSGPERIETGWWDGGDIRRDYYAVRTREGVRLWIFRERRGDRCWFLHGVFS